MSYRIIAKGIGGITLNEEFKYLRPVLRAAKVALKAGMTVTITKVKP